MSELADMMCVPCWGGVPALSAEENQALTQFEFQAVPASSRRPALSPAGRGISRANTAIPQGRSLAPPEKRLRLG
jgi:hypothetical protein